MIKEKFFTEEEEVELLNQKKLIGKNSILKHDEEFLFLEKDEEIEPIKIKKNVDKKELKIENIFIIENVIKIKNDFVDFHKEDIESLNKEKHKKLKECIMKVIKNNVSTYYSEDSEKIKELESKGYLIRLDNINININNYYTKEFKTGRFYKYIYFYLF